jgi:hypothetical protein
MYGFFIETLPLDFRLFCSNMHFNENSKRDQAKTKQGDDRWFVVYPKAFKGEKAIARQVKECPTFSKFFTNVDVVV